MPTSDAIGFPPLLLAILRTSQFYFRGFPSVMFFVYLITADREQREVDHSEHNRKPSGGGGLIPYVS